MCKPILQAYFVTDCKDFSNDIIFCKTSWGIFFKEMTSYHFLTGCGLARKLTRDIEQILQADPDRWPGLRLCKINGHKEPQLAASHGLHRQWPAVTVYLRGRAISYPVKLVAQPLLEALETVMKMRTEDVPIRTIGSVREWRGLLQETEEVIVFYDRCRGGEAGVRRGGTAVRWQNGTVSGGQMACSGSCLRGVVPFQGGGETAVTSSSSRVVGNHAGAVMEQHVQDRCKAAEELNVQKVGVFEQAPQCPAPQARPPVFPKTCPAPAIPSSSGYLETRDQTTLGDAEVDDQAPCSYAEANQAALIRAEAEDLAWRLLLVPSKLLLVRVTDPGVLEAALKKEVVESRESVNARSFGDWVQDLLSTLVFGDVNALSFGASAPWGGSFGGRLWRGIGRSLVSSFGRFWNQEESLGGIEKRLGVGEESAFAESGAETGQFPSEASESTNESVAEVSRISKLPWLVLVQTQGRGPPRGFYGGTNLTAFLEGVPYAQPEELKYDEIGGAFEPKLPVVLLFVDLYSRSEAVRDASRQAIKDLRAAGEKIEGFRGNSTGLAEEGSLLEGLRIEGLEGSGEKTEEGLVAGEEEGLECDSEEAKEGGAESVEGAPRKCGRTVGARPDGSGKGAEGELGEAVEAEATGKVVKDGWKKEKESNTASSGGKDDDSALQDGAGIGGNGEETSGKQAAESAPAPAEADGTAHKMGTASSGEGSQGSFGRGVEVEQALRTATPSAGLQNVVVSGGSSAVARAGGSQPGAVKAASGLHGGNTQAFFEQLATRLNGMPPGSTFEIEVHETPQQGLTKQAALGASVEALSEGVTTPLGGGQGSGQEKAKETDSGGEELGETGEGGTGMFKYVYMDGEEALPQRMGFEVDLKNGVGVPALVIVDADNGAFYVYPPERPLSEGGIEEFLVSFRGGLLQPSLMSERPPWLPPRLPKGTRAAFPLPSVSAADFSARVFGRPATAESAKDGSEGGLGGASTSQSHLDRGRESEPERISVKRWSLLNLFLRRRDSGASSKTVLSPPGNGASDAQFSSRGAFAHSDAPPGTSTLVLFTTNWCGFCQRAEVVLQEVARLLESGTKVGVSGTAGSAGVGVSTPKRSRASEAGMLGENEQGNESSRLRLFRMDCDVNDCARVTGLQVRLTFIAEDVILE